MAIYDYNLKSQDPTIRHIGPVAQDFATLGYGENDWMINTQDADGVALAAIQGLYELAQEQNTRIEALKVENATQQAQIADLEARLAALEDTAGSEPAASSWPAGPLGVGLLLAGVGQWVWRKRRLEG